MASDFFSLSFQHLRHLNRQQAAISNNIANSTTPAYKSISVAPFSTSLHVEQRRHVGDVLLHQSLSDSSLTRGGLTRPLSDASTISGNNVNLEKELLNSGQVRRLADINLTTTKAFHKMYLLSARA
jgi:flagellar basal-body rod protein FlgB